MHRSLLYRLLDWKDRPERKPLLIDGARQTGKTWLLQRLLGREFEHVVRLDFLENPSLQDAFVDSLEPRTLLMNIELLTGEAFNPDQDLLILDEIAECPRAVTALKYFAEEMPHAFIAASGSNIGLLASFPVGKVEQYQLRPFSFHEFLMACAEHDPADQSLLHAYDRQMNSAAAHTRLFDKLTDYYFTGGMPEAVDAWVTKVDQSLLERTRAVNQIHADLTDGYRRDFGKYAGRLDAQLIAAVFDNVPSQLAAVQDDSVKRFRFKDVYRHKDRYAEFENAIEWLHRSRLVLKNHPINGTPRTPLAAYRQPNKVKLFMFDVGLLNHLLGYDYRAVKRQGDEYKGYVAENFVQQELAVMGMEPGSSWAESRAEIEFLVTDADGHVIPVEVKSGKRTRAKSLRSYIDKCAPVQTIKLTGTRGSPATETTHRVVPLYYVGHLPSVLDSGL